MPTLWKYKNILYSFLYLIALYLYYGIIEDIFFLNTTKAICVGN